MILFFKNTSHSAFSAPLRDNSMLNIQHRLVFRLYKNRQQLPDKARITTAYIRSIDIEFYV